MALPPTALQRLLGAATSADHLFELLRLAGCLTPRGRNNRSMVTGMMTRAREQFEPPYTMGDPGFDGHTCPGAWEAVEGPLTNGGYLQVNAWPDAWKYVSMMSVEERVQAIIDKALPSASFESDDDLPWLHQADELKRARRRATAEPGPLACPACGKALPDESQFCPWCRAKLRFACSCGL